MAINEKTQEHLEDWRTLCSLLAQAHVRMVDRTCAEGKGVGRRERLGPL